MVYADHMWSATLDNLTVFGVGNSTTGNPWNAHAVELRLEFVGYTVAKV